MAGIAEPVARQADELYEYDREPVDPCDMKSGRQFAAIFAGEHVAGTEFVIGALFVLHGVGFWDLIIGLLVGNLLAVLSWTFLCAPIATRVRLTLYWYLRRVTGPGLTAVYNVANAVLYCILAGAMIAVATTAIGLAFGLPTPDLTAVLPPGIGWVLISLSIGALMTLVAILGFEELSRFAKVCSPWIFVAFIAGAVAVLPRLGVEPDLSNLYAVATTEIWNGAALPGQQKFTVWHVMFFAWVANLAMHVGLSDMALLRYAKDWKYGLYSAIGMYLGHFLAWICSGVLVAAIGRELNPGLMAYEALGLAGAAAVLLAGWTTANPTLYRAGLALQTVTPDWPRWKVTLIAGAVTAVVACFPVVFLELLGYVAIYGIILMPIGAVVVAEFWILPRLGLPRLGVASQEAERDRERFSWEAALVWALALLFCYLLNQMGLHVFFVWLPGYVFALGAYTALKVAFGRARSARAEAGQRTPADRAPAEQPPKVPSQP